ncbi:hypothetical protein [Streptosporangium amethystogenes]|uniref:hypothetical protein n=1 Tax=Streptosporangium amethystogenes TaxID=2002 RepID=UPI0012FBA242|nr:hypothetical protein [Streptosporangium amethystogenes]
MKDDMRRPWAVIVRTLCIAALAATGLATTTTTAAATATELPRWGFAVVRGGAVVDSRRQAGSWPDELKVEATAGDPGQVLVRFPQIGMAAGGVAHVTAISQSADWCQIQGWWQSGADEIVAVQCHRYGVGPIASWFSVTFGYSPQYLPAPQAFGYVHWNGSAVAARFNSSAPTAVNTAEPLTAPGLWRVTLPRLGSADYAGNIQVTAVDSAVPARCKLGGWNTTTAAQSIVVRCYDATGTPLNTGWSLTYHRERALTWTPPSYRFAYTFDNLPDTPGVYRPTPYQVSYNSQSGGVQLSRSAVARRQVIFGGLSGYRDNVQVTAFGYGSEFCNLFTPWESYSAYVSIRYVTCYNGAVQVDHPAMITYLTR